MKRELEEMRIPTAAYCRLSLEGEDSIDNQVKLVHDYINESPDLLLVDTYIDNGLTGTNFDRPEWNRLMLDVQQGRINAIVVKDLSRFGRHYVETGTYIGKIFPKLGVRFIAITDGFDSTKPGELSRILVPVKNMMNHFYARDMSDKIHKVLNEKKRNGEVLGTPAFGFFRTSDGAKLNQLRIDEETAPVMRMMYRWAAMGVELTEIAARLNLMAVPSPYGKKWDVCSLRKMLENPVYYGDFISGKWVKNMHVKTKTDKESWLVFEEHHEGLVSRELWDAAQANLGMKGKRIKVPRILDGVLVCATCGHPLGAERSRNGVTFFCPNHTGVTMKKKGAASMMRRPSITEAELKETVLQECREHLEWITEVKPKIKFAERPRGIIGRLEKKSIDLMREKKAADESLVNMYRDYLEGIMDMDTFQDGQKKASELKWRTEKEIEAVLSEQRQAKAKQKQIMDYLGTIYRVKIDEWDEEKIRRLTDRISLEPNGKVRVSFFMKDEMDSLIHFEFAGEEASPDSVGKGEEDE